MNQHAKNGSRLSHKLTGLENLLGSMQSAQQSDVNKQAKKTPA